MSSFCASIITYNPPLFSPYRVPVLDQDLVSCLILDLVFFWEDFIDLCGRSLPLFSMKGLRFGLNLNLHGWFSPSFLYAGPCLGSGDGRELNM